MRFTILELAQKIIQIERRNPADVKDVQNRLKNLSQRISIPIEKRGNQGFLTDESAAGAYLLMTLQETGLNRELLTHCAKRIFETLPVEDCAPSQIETAVRAIKNGDSGNFVIRVLINGEFRVGFDFGQSDEVEKVAQIIGDWDAARLMWTKTEISIHLGLIARLFQDEE